MKRKGLYYYPNFIEYFIDRKQIILLLQGEEQEEKGRRLIQEGINIRKKLGVPLYVAAGYSELAREYVLQSHKIKGS